MDEQTHKLLLDADIYNEWYGPSDDAGSLWNEIDALIPSLESIVGSELDADRYVQDASFLTDVGALDAHYYDRQSGAGSIVYVFAFRFSSFGRLVTLHGTAWRERFNDFHLADARELLRTAGFSYIAAEDLQSPYDGVNGPSNPISGEPITWWTRYFDYI